MCVGEMRQGVGAHFRRDGKHTQVSFGTTTTTTMDLIESRKTREIEKGEQGKGYKCETEQKRERER